VGLHWYTVTPAGEDSGSAFKRAASVTQSHSLDSVHREQETDQKPAVAGTNGRQLSIG